MDSIFVARIRARIFTTNGEDSVPANGVDFCTDFPARFPSIHAKSTPPTIQKSAPILERCFPMVSLGAQP